MKNLFTLFLITSLAFTFSRTDAQTDNYHPFPDSNAQWNIHFLIYGMPGFYEEFYSINMTGDTMISGQVYHKLFTPFVQSSAKSPATFNQPGYQGGIRQDTALRKVWFIPPSDTAEQLLYDFTLQVGDTVLGYLQPEGTVKDVVNSIDSVMVGNEYHKRWNINAFYSISLIEGVGWTYGLIKKSMGMVADGPDYSITCFKQNGETLYPDTVTACDIITSIKPVENNSDLVRIYPNPSDGIVNIEIDPSLKVTQLTITDMQGRVILQQGSGFEKILKLDLPQGMYLLSILNSGSEVLSKKILVYPKE